MKTLKIGITGAGAFAECFIPLFKAHPAVSSVALAELIPARRKHVGAKFGVEEVYASHEQLCRSDVDAIAIITQRHLHAPQAVAALDAGKHVYCAVPAAVSEEELRQLIQVVERTGLKYMMGETSYYYPAAIYCRTQFDAGLFGDFVYGEGEYMHDMSHGFYEAYQHSGGADWKQVAGFPPMYYCTHSTSMILSTVGEHMTHVSCLGFRDRHDDAIFGASNNLWDNPFSNQTALYRTSGGGMCRVNEFRRIGDGYGTSVRINVLGTDGCFEQQADSSIWTDHKREVASLNSQLRCDRTQGNAAGTWPDGTQKDFHCGMAEIHPTERLPESFKGQPNGHEGSHQFLVDDFVRCMVQDQLPPNHAWAAARYTLPGIIAHQSALQEGVQLPVPDLGAPPAGTPSLSYPAWEDASESDADDVGRI